MKYLFDRITIYPKLTLTFLLVLFPLFYLSLAMNEYGSNNVKTEITNSMLSKVHFYNSALENEFTRIIQLMREFAGYRDLDLLGNRSEIMSNYEKQESIKKLQKELSVIKHSSHYVLSASVHIPSINRTISDNNFSEIPQDKFQALNVVTNIYESPFIHWRDRLFISLPYPIQSNNRTPEFIVEIEISMQLLEQALQQFTDHTTGNAMLVNLAKDWKITAASGQDILKESTVIDKIGSAQQGLQQAEMDDEHYWVAFEHSKVLGTILIMYEREQTIMGPLRQFRIWFWMISGLSLIIVIIVSYSVYRLIHQPLRNLVRAFRKVEQGNLSLTVEHRGNDEFKYLYSQFNRMVQRLQHMIYEIGEQKYRTQHAELKQLQSQINPHFLYNSLFILYRLAKKNGDENQIKFAKYLSDYFQFMTRNSSDEVALAEEVRHARNYVEIQKFRFAHHIEVIFEELPAAYESLVVPRLILQPIIENAYKYGLEHKEAESKLQIRFMEEADSLIIQVEDNGDHSDAALAASLQHRLDDIELSQETTGLINVHKRLRYRFGSGYGLVISKEASNLFRVSLKLPKIG